MEQFLTNPKKILRYFRKRTGFLFKPLFKQICCFKICCILYNNYTGRYIISKFNKNEAEFYYSRFQKRDYLGRYTKYKYELVEF